MDDIRTSCAAELRSVLDSYIGPGMHPDAATAVMEAMQEATAYMMVRYGMGGAYQAGDVAQTLGVYMHGIGLQLTALQRPADWTLRR